MITTTPKSSKGIEFYISIFISSLISTSIYAHSKPILITDNYHIKLSFDFSEEKINGVCDLTIKNSSEETIHQIPLILYRLMAVKGIKNIDGENISFTQTVKQFEDFPKLQANHIVINKTLLPHTQTVLTVFYEGYLCGYRETGMLYITDRVSPDFTLIRNDAFSYPIVSEPSMRFLRENSFNYPFAYTIEITVPDLLVVANGGVLESVTHKDGLSTYRYTSLKHSTRIDIAIARYQQTQEGIINMFYFEEDSESANILIKNGSEALKMYRNWWGKLPETNTITVIETEKNSGGQASETSILLPQEAFTDERSYDYFYHELSHLWNVEILEENGLSPRWNEGLAMFCQYLVTEKLDSTKEGKTEDTSDYFLRELKNELEYNTQLAKTPPIDYGNQSITEYSYSQGMIMFTILYDWLGEENFHRTLKNFIHEYFPSGASTRVFTEYWRKSLNNDTLDVFFNDWMYTTNYTRFILAGKKTKDIVNYYHSK